MGFGVEGLLIKRLHFTGGLSGGYFDIYVLVSQKNVSQVSVTKVAKKILQRKLKTPSPISDITFFSRYNQIAREQSRRGKLVYIYINFVLESRK